VKNLVMSLVNVFLNHITCTNHIDIYNDGWYLKLRLNILLKCF